MFAREFTSKQAKASAELPYASTWKSNESNTGTQVIMLRINVLVMKINIKVVYKTMFQSLSVRHVSRSYSLNSWPQTKN